MSGVGSTNAMKKGSGNNPFLAYSEADMQSYLNAAYTGCIVKYAGPSTKTLVTIGSHSFDAQNLIVDTSIPFVSLSPDYREYDLKIEKTNTNNTVATSYITHQWIHKDDGKLYGPGSSGDPADFVYTLLQMSEEDYLNANSIKDITVKFLAVTESVSETPSLINLNSAWPITKSINGWQADCFNADGRITLWGYGETVTCVEALHSSPNNLYYESYIVNELYKVAYSDGQYYFDEFYYISENVTTGTVEDVAAGKTFYDFTGTKQTGIGTKINPYLAADVTTFQSFPIGSFIKWIGIDDTVLADSTKLYTGQVYQAVIDGDTNVYMLLPELENPADPIDIAEGKEAISQTGTILVGTGNVILQAATTESMQAFSVEVNIGKIVKYVGETDVYVKDALYQVIDVGQFAQYYELPELSNEGTAADLAEGKELINSNGEKVVGTASSGGDYFVKVIDYDGTVLLEKRGNTGDVINLPSAPTHDKLVFQAWSASQAITDNKITIANDNVMVGAVYTTASGQNEFDITLTKVTGLSVKLNMNGTKDWGDGTSDTDTIHTYTTYGNYTIKCNGSTYTSSSLFGQSSSFINYYCIAARFMDSVTSISSYAFQYCYSLTSVTIPNSVTSIGDYAFQYCSSLTSVTIPNGVTSIGSSAFRSCYSLTSVTIPNSVTSIGDYDFRSCYSLTSITIGNGVTSIGSYAFEGCSSLTSMTIGNGVTSIGNYAFQYCYSLTSVTIPNGVTSIGNYAFQYCYSLTSVTIPNGVTSIGSSAFRSCYSLTSVTIPNSVTSISSYAFQYCYSLTSVTIPNSVTSISSYAFQYCYTIKKYYFLQNTRVPTLFSDVFTGINAVCKIIVPDSLYDAWIAASNWSTYANYIYKASEVV